MDTFNALFLILKHWLARAAQNHKTQRKTQQRSFLRSTKALIRVITFRKKLNCQKSSSVLRVAKSKPKHLLEDKLNNQNHVLCVFLKITHLRFSNYYYELQIPNGKIWILQVPKLSKFSLFNETSHSLRRKSLRNVHLWMAKILPHLKQEEFHVSSQIFLYCFTPSVQCASLVLLNFQKTEREKRTVFENWVVGNEQLHPFSVLVCSLRW